MVDLAQPVREMARWGHAIMAADEERGDGRLRREALLQRLVEREVVPRLVLAHRAARAASQNRRQDPDQAAGSDVAELVALVLAHDSDGAVAFAERILARGAGIASLFADVLEPAAERLERLCRQGGCDVIAATLAGSCLRQLLHRYAAEFQGPPPHADDGHRALLSALPGEPHIFATLLAAAFLRRAGWTVCANPVATCGELARQVRSAWYSLVGISLSRADRLDVLAAGILAIRRASRNPRIGVMVVGRPFSERPERVRLVGADAMAAGARQAPEQADHLISLLAARG
jgi:hypothetical protein